MTFDINKKIAQIILSIIAVALFPFFCLAAQPLDIVINEIAWMGTTISSNDEWIELYNNTEHNINLDGWNLAANDGTPEIKLLGNIPGKGFFLLERTDDESVPKIPADLIYKGALNNNGEYLKLIDKQEKIIDEVNCSNGWFSGDNQAKKTMQKMDTLASGNNLNNWGTSQDINGTPKTKNNIEKSIIEEEPKTTPLTANQFPEITYPNGIVLNEILPSPEGPDDENEYIEIFNQNDFEVDTSGWSLKDTLGSVKAFVFPQKTKILAKNFLVFYRTKTKITLNNSEDGVQLFKPNKELADEIQYKKATTGQSFNRIGENWQWSLNLTPGAENIILEEKEKTANVGDDGGATSVASEKKSNVLEIKEKELLAGFPEILSAKTIQEKIPKNFIFIFLAAGLMGFISGISIIFLKKKLKNKTTKKSLQF